MPSSQANAPVQAVFGGQPPVQTALASITVCICTYKRPDLLGRLLGELRSQQTDSRFVFSVVVADNDRERSAEPVVGKFAEESGIPTVYCVEARQSIALARNKAVANASGDFIAFIDDDEFPAQDWLRRLFNTCKDYDVAGVLGPVKRHFDEQPPAWLEKSNLYERPNHPTGYVLTWREGRSGNLFFKREMLAGLDMPFNPDFRTGEDQDFLRRMMGSGRKFIWCDEAAVFETVPPIRWNRSFMLKRALLRGAMEPKVATFGVRDVVKSAVAVPLYAIALPFAALLGQHRSIPLLIRLCDHLGKLLALIGINPVSEEYVTQ